MFVELDDIELQRFKLVIIKYITLELAKHFGEQCKVDLVKDVQFAFDDVVTRIVQVVWGRQLEKIECKYPANWKEAIKERFAPRWFLERWPVEYTTVVLNARELYPRLAFPEKDYAIHLFKQESGTNG